MMNRPNIRVEVAYARPDRQLILETQVPEGSSCTDAVHSSGILQAFPEIDPDRAAMGIFGKRVMNPARHPVAEGDRVEIYRPLKVAPGKARLARARGSL